MTAADHYLDGEGRMRIALFGLVALIILGALAPRAALAQLGLGLGLGSAVVTVTAPGNGAHVTGTIAVKASVTIIGGLTVQSVHFKLDGADHNARRLLAKAGASRLSSGV